jgi:SAM-dependent methyltransferase
VSVATGGTLEQQRPLSPSCPVIDPRGDFESGRIMARSKWYDAQSDRLVFYGGEATPDYWDQLWDEAAGWNFEKKVRSHANRFYIKNVARKYLPDRGDRVLEGGCGLGGYVYRLHHLGYRVTGLDFAPTVVQRLRKHFPELDIVEGDVRALDFEDESFGLYLSFGVIEHFAAGYEDILREAYRVLKPGGRLLITVPYLSPLRRFKARLGHYDDRGAPESFFQYAYRPRALLRDLEGLGFRFLDLRSRSGFVGLQEEVQTLAPILDPLGRSSWMPSRVTRYALGKLIAPITGHTMQIVVEKAD